jgi:hypothetical protein
MVELPDNLTLFVLGKTVPLETELCDEMSEEGTNKSSSKGDPKFNEAIIKNTSY